MTKVIKNKPPATTPTLEGIAHVPAVDALPMQPESAPSALVLLSAAKQVTSTTVRSKTILVTPDLAKALLDPLVNDCNRGRSKASVQKYQWDIDHDEWKQNGETIKISKTGRLIDGQHRLMAIVLSGKAVACLVVTGVDDNDASTIDKGRGRRTRDTFKMQGIPFPGPTASICRSLRMFYNPSESTISDAQAQDTYDAHLDGFKWAHVRFGAARVSGSIQAAHIYAYPTATEAVDTFAEQFMSGVGLSDKSPVLALKNASDWRKGFSTDPRQVFLRTLTCLSYAVRGKTLAKVFASEVGIEHFSKARAKLGLP